MALGGIILGALVGPGVLTFSLYTGFAFSFKAFAMRMVLGLALNALSPKPKVVAANRGYQVNSRGSALSHQIIYGKMRVGGAIVYDEATGTNNKFFHRIIALAGHEVESFDRIYINDSYIDFADIIVAFTIVDGDFDPPSQNKTSGIDDYALGAISGGKADLTPVAGNTDGVLTINKNGKSYSANIDGSDMEITTSNIRVAFSDVGVSADVKSPTVVELSFEEVEGGNIPTVVDADGSTSDRYDGKLRIQFAYGTSDQPANSGLISESAHWTAESKLSGIAYMYVRLEFDADVYPNSVPQFTAEIKGKKLYNPATDTTVWSDNPALCLRDYLTNSYGLSELPANIDDTLVNSAVTVCNQTNTGAGTTRYTCNGAFTTDLTPYDIINDLLTSMGGTLWYSQGKWRMKPAYWTTPALDLNEDDLRSSISVATRHSRRDNFNVVKGTFRGEESNWQTTDYPQVDSAAFLSADNGQESVADVDLPFTDNSIEARRIARISLEGNRQQLTVNASFGLRAMQVQVGDNVRLTNTRFGWSNKEFQVLAWNFGLADGLDLQVDLTLRETAESVFDEFDDGIVYERDNTTLVSPFTAPSVGISVVGAAQVSNQKVSNIAIATVTSGRPEAIDYVEVEYKLSSDTIFSVFGQGQLGEFRVRDLEIGDYDFRARSVNTFGIKSEWEYLSDVEINAFIGDPSDVSGLTKEISGGTLFLSWTPIPDPDLSHYQIKHNSNTTGATWSNSTTIIDKIARPATSASVPARSGTFLIRAYDKEGNFSVTPTSTVVLPAEIPQLGVTITETENPSFSGSKTNTIVSSGNLEIDNTSASEPTGDYFFNNYVDTSTSRNARITGFRTFTRSYDNGTLLWDDIPENWDTWPNNWDTWTDEDANFGDVSVQVFVSATDDDPAGSPTWGSYTPANGAFVTGRAFRFKAVLTSTNTNFTPAVSALSVTVEY